METNDHSPKTGQLHFRLDRNVSKKFSEESKDNHKLDWSTISLYEVAERKEHYSASLIKILHVHDTYTYTACVMTYGRQEDHEGDVHHKRKLDPHRIQLVP